MTTSWKNLELFLNLDDEFQKKKKSLTSALIKACTRNKKQDLIDAIKAGGYINSFDEYQTPLMACVESGSLELAKYLIRLNASASIVVNKKDAFWLALERGKYDFLTIFFETRGKPCISKEDGKTLLIQAVQNSDLQAVEVIAYKVEVNQKDYLGNTALHYNLMKNPPNANDIEIAKILIARGADTNTSNLDGVTPENVAVSEEAQIMLQRFKMESEIPQTTPTPVSASAGLNASIENSVDSTIDNADVLNEGMEIDFDAPAPTPASQPAVNKPKQFKI